jgi:orotidine-5'-phosphate decarboxylase
VATKAEALEIVNELGDRVSFYKVGLQLFVAEGMPFVRELIQSGKRVFLDLKMDDVEETITLAVREIAKNNVDLITLHGNAATTRAALSGRGDARIPKVLSVTLLSSLDGQDLKDVGMLGANTKSKTLIEHVLHRAEQAVAAGADGLIASGESIAQVRAKVGARPLIVSPGIRPPGSPTDEHKRSTTPSEAILAGADFLVVGRPIRNASDRRAMAERIIDDIEQAASARS